jgi:hypothetical protein
VLEEESVGKIGKPPLNDGGPQDKEEGSSPVKTDRTLGVEVKHFTWLGLGCF